MAEIPIHGGSNPTGSCFWAPVSTQLTLANSKSQYVLVMPEPAGAGDHGIEGAFQVPGDYSSSPVLVIRGILDGTPANTLAFGCQILSLADSESFDAAYAAEDTASNGTWTGYADEDLYEETITLSTPTFAANDEVFFHFYWDDSVASPFTGDFLLTGLYFQYTAA